MDHIATHLYIFISAYIFRTRNPSSLKCANPGITYEISVNAAISCAGIAVSRRTLSNNSSRVHSLLDFNHALQVNAVGTFNLARLSAERMSRHAPDSDGLRGCIINTASIAGKIMILC